MKTLQNTLPPTEDISISAATLAARWGCSAMTVKRRIKSGQIRAHKNGRLVRITMSEIVRFERETLI